MKVRKTTAVLDHDEPTEISKLLLEVLKHALQMTSSSREEFEIEILLL